MPFLQEFAENGCECLLSRYAEGMLVCNGYNVRLCRISASCCVYVATDLSSPETTWRALDDRAVRMQAPRKQHWSVIKQYRHQIHGHRSWAASATWDCSAPAPAPLLCVCASASPTASHLSLFLVDPPTMGYMSSNKSSPSTRPQKCMRKRWLVQQQVQPCALPAWTLARS